MTGVWVLLGVLVLSGVAGALMRARNGRIRAAKPGAPTLPGRVSG
ncbi:thioredoxin, partial [Amycolatopsis japonica]